MVNNKLNTKIWENDTLKEDVKQALLRVVEQFKEELQIPIDIVDIRIVGSNASYNYTDKSDIDLHLVVNTETLPFYDEILELYYHSARGKFNRDFNIKIKGLPVELSIENIKSNVVSNGIYSLIEDKWVKYPEKIDIGPIKDMTKSVQFLKLTNEINQILDNPTSASIREIIDRIYMIRKNSIASDGEYGEGNLLFKAIRDSGLLQKLKDSLYDILSKELTLENFMDSMTLMEALELSEV